MKSYTDIEQSKKLAEILPLESADMCYTLLYTDASLTGQSKYNDFPCVLPSFAHGSSAIPCWSLVALLEQLPYELCDDDGNSLYLQIYKDDDMYQLVYEDLYGNFENIETDVYEHFVDACYEMILKLHELNLL